MDFAVGLSVPDHQHAHIVVYSCRGASKISKITGSGPIWDQVPKNDENFKKSKKITFSKLVRGSFLHIPCALWELRNTSKRVFRIDFELFRSLDRTWIWDSGWKTTKNRENLNFPNMFGNRFWTSLHTLSEKNSFDVFCSRCATPINIFSHHFSSSNMSLIRFHSIQPKLKNIPHKFLVFLLASLARIGSCVFNCALLDSMQ